MKVTPEEIYEAILACGVPGYTTQTTLLKQGQRSLRKWVEERRFEKSGLFLYANTNTKVVETQRAFATAAKEVVLSNGSVAFVPLHVAYRFVLSSFGGEAPTYIAADLESARYIFITDFCKRGFQGNPRTQNAVYEFVSWVSDRKSHSCVFSFMSEVPLSQCSDWWPDSFLLEIQQSTEAMVIE